MAEIRRSGTWGSALTSDEFAAVRSVGFQPVGQVLGAAVYNIGYTGGYGCPGAWGGYNYAWAPAARTQVSSRGGYGSFGPLVKTMYEARRTAIGRMVAECAELGGHGVVGVRLTIGQFPTGGLEFKAIGTAVSAPGAPRLRPPFTSDLSGQDFAKLVHSGWMPAGLALGITIAARHDDWQTVGQTCGSAGASARPRRAATITSSRRSTSAPPSSGSRAVIPNGISGLRSPSCPSTRSAARRRASTSAKTEDKRTSMTNQQISDFDAAGVPQDAIKRLAELQPGK